MILIAFAKDPIEQHFVFPISHFDPTIEHSPDCDPRAVTGLAINTWPIPFARLQCGRRS